MKCRGAKNSGNRKLMKEGCSNRSRIREEGGVLVLLPVRWLALPEPLPWKLPLPLQWARQEVG